MSKIDEKQVDEFLQNLKTEILSRQKYKIEAVVHEANFDTIPEPGTILDGCMIVYLDDSNRERLAEDLVSRKEKDQREVVKESLLEVLDRHYEAESEEGRVKEYINLLRNLVKDM